MTKIVTEIGEILDKGDKIEIEEGILYLERDPEITIIQEGHTENNTTIEIEVKMDNNGSKANPDAQLEDLELHQGLQAEIKTAVSVRDNLVILPKNVLRRTLLQAN